MIRHMLLFSFRDDAGGVDRQRLLADLRRFPAVFSEIQDFELGRNASRRDQAFQYGMTMSFGSFEELQAYLDSDEHERFLANRFRPLVRQRAIVSFEI